MDNNSIVMREDNGAVSILTMNRPERLNAFNDELGRRIIEHCTEIERDDSIRVVILTGAGERAFCAGADLQEAETHAIVQLEHHVWNLTERGGAQFFEFLIKFKKPIICAVNGYAVGIGFQMQLCCDMIVASTTAKFKLPQVQLGIMPAYGGAPRLAQWVGRGKAAEIALSGRFVDASEAERIGLVTSVVEPDDLLTEATRLASVIAEASPLSLAMTKESLRGAMEDGSLHLSSVADMYRFTALSLSAESGSRHREWRVGAGKEPAELR